MNPCSRCGRDTSFVGDATHGKYAGQPLCPRCQVYLEEMQAQAACPDCGGTGFSSPAISCPRCEGRGTIPTNLARTYPFHLGELTLRLLARNREKGPWEPDARKDKGETEEYIHLVVPVEAGITSITFDDARGVVAIEARQPGLVIGKLGAHLKKIKEHTFWVPIVRRVRPGGDEDT